MAIQFISVKCPECNATLSIEKERSMAFCTYCGTKILLNNENEHVYRQIDEARIREAELEQMVRLKELEMEERETARSRKAHAIAFGVALAFVLVGALICIRDSLAGMWAIVLGIWIALFAVIISQGDRKTRRNEKDD